MSGASNETSGSNNVWGFYAIILASPETGKADFNALKFQEGLTVLALGFCEDQYGRAHGRGRSARKTPAYHPEISGASLKDVPVTVFLSCSTTIEDPFQDSSSTLFHHKVKMSFSLSHLRRGGPPWLHSNAGSGQSYPSGGYMHKFVPLAQRQG